MLYTAVGKGPDKWSVNVDFSNDSEAKEIARALRNMRGYQNVTLFAFDDGLGFDLFGATPAYADDTSSTPAQNSGSNDQNSGT